MDDEVRRNATTSLSPLLTLSLDTVPLVGCTCPGAISGWIHPQESTPGHGVGQRRDENGSGGEFLAQMPTKVWL